MLTNLGLWMFLAASQSRSALRTLQLLSSASQPWNQTDCSTFRGLKPTECWMADSFTVLRDAQGLQQNIGESSKIHSTAEKLSQPTNSIPPVNNTLNPLLKLLYATDL